MTNFLKLVLLTMLIVQTGCLNKKDDDDGVTSSSCSFEQEWFAGLYSSTIAPGEKIAQRFKLLSFVRLNTATFEMDVLNSTSVKLSIYSTDYGSTSPMGATLIGESIIDSSQVDNTGKITFKFNAVPIIPGPDHYLVFEGTGGNFKMTTAYRSFFNLYGEVWEFASGTWNDQTDYDLSLGITGKCK